MSNNFRKNNMQGNSEEILVFRVPQSDIRICVSWFQGNEQPLQYVYVNLMREYVEQNNN